MRDVFASTAWFVPLGPQLCKPDCCWTQTVGRATGAAADAAEATKQKASDIGSKAYDATAQVHTCIGNLASISSTTLLVMYLLPQASSHHWLGST